MTRIYKIRFKDPNKIYIGSTMQSFNKRKNQHLSQLRNNKHSNYKLQNDFNKYGEKFFNFEVHEEIKNPKVTIKRETYWYYEFLKLGYELYNYYPPKDPPFLKRKHTEKSKEKMSKTNKGRKRSKQSNLKEAISKGAKLFYVLKDNKIVAQYINQRECAKKLNLNHSHINRCLHNHRKTHKGYTFKYLTKIINKS